jgi:hypothetical protein
MSTKCVTKLIMLQKCVMASFAHTELCLDLIHEYKIAIIIITHTNLHFRLTYGHYILLGPYSCTWKRATTLLIK